MANPKKPVKIDLEDIPSILEKIVGVMNREIDLLGQKSFLNSEESKILTSYASTLQTIFKEYRAEEAATKKELRAMSPAEIKALYEAEVRS